MGIEKYTKRLTKTVEQSLASVIAVPDGVLLEIQALNGELTPQQARDLAALLTTAAEDARHLDYEDENDPSSTKLVDDRA